MKKMKSVSSIVMCSDDSSFSSWMRWKQKDLTAATRAVIHQAHPMM